MSTRLGACRSPNWARSSRVQSCSRLSSRPCCVWIPQTTLSRSFSSSSPSPRHHSFPAPYYDIFPNTLPDGPPPSGPFAINLRALQREYLQLQSIAHPDLQNQPKKQPVEAGDGRPKPDSAFINTAYRTLLSPLLRAQYILSCRGRDGHLREDTQTLARDHSFLTAVLEVRESMEEATCQGEIDEITTENQEKMDDCVGRLEKLFAADNLDEIEAEVMRFKYWSSISASLHDWEVPTQPQP